KSYYHRQDLHSFPTRRSSDLGKSDVPVGDLGSGSDYTVFLQHLGVPSTDVSSTGSYGVYHSVFDNFAWFKKFGDPDFTYEQEMRSEEHTSELQSRSDLVCRLL